MDPLAVASVATVYIKLLRSLTSAGQITRGLGDVLAEVELLSSILLESTAVISELGAMAPKSTSAVLEQCQRTGDELYAIVERFNRSKDAGSKRFMLVLTWSIKQQQVEALLTSFRTSCHLLRQMAADAMTKSMLQRQMFRLELRIEEMQSRLENPHAGYTISDEPVTNVPNPREISSQIGGPRPEHGVSRQRAGDFYQTEEFDPFLRRGTICLGRIDEIHAMWHPIKIMLDSQSSFNVVTSTALAGLGLHGPFQKLKPADAMTAKGTFHLEEGITLRWTFDMDRTIYTTEFYVVPGDWDLLIGGPFIRANKHKEGLFPFWRVFGASPEEALQTQQETDRLDDAAMAASSYNPPVVQTAPPSTSVANMSNATPTTTNISGQTGP